MIIKSDTSFEYEPMKLPMREKWTKEYPLKAKKRRQDELEARPVHKKLKKDAEEKAKSNAKLIKEEKEREEKRIRNEPKR